MYYYTSEFSGVAIGVQGVQCTLHTGLAIWGPKNCQPIATAFSSKFERLNVYTVFRKKKLDSLLFHNIFAVTATNCMKIYTVYKHKVENFYIEL